MKTGYRRFDLILVAVMTLSTHAASQNPSTPHTSPTLKIIHFNVGNGDATLVVIERDSKKKTLLIDGGSSQMAGNVVIPGIKQEISSQGIDYAVATHYDPEHRDGLETVVRSIGMSEGGMVYDRDRAWPSAPSRTADGEKAVDRPLQPGSRISLDPDVVIECVAANGNTKRWRWITKDPPLDENAQSLAFLITLGKFRYFVGGDLTGGGRSGWNATPNIESAIASDVGEVSVLRVNHHGSCSSTNQAFLSTLNPLVAVISTGHDQVYQWPCREVLDRLNALPRLNAVYVTGDVATPKGLTADDKKKVKSSQGTITIVTTGGADFQVNGTRYSLK